MPTPCGQGAVADREVGRGAFDCSQLRPWPSQRVSYRTSATPRRYRHVPRIAPRYCKVQTRLSRLLTLLPPLYEGSPVSFDLRLWPGTMHIVRRGQTAWRAERRTQGRRDSDCAQLSYCMTRRQCSDMCNSHSAEHRHVPKIDPSILLQIQMQSKGSARKKLEESPIRPYEPSRAGPTSLFSTLRIQPDGRADRSSPRER